MMTGMPAELVLEMIQGATFRFGFTYVEDAVDEDGKVIEDEFGNPVPGEPRDWTAAPWVGRMQVREDYLKPVLISIDGPPAIVLDADGHVQITISAVSTDNLRTTGRNAGAAIKNGVFDLEVYLPDDPDTVEQPIRGTVVVKPNTTRDDP